MQSEEKLLELPQIEEDLLAVSMVPKLSPEEISKQKAQLISELVSLCYPQETEAQRRELLKSVFTQTSELASFMRCEEEEFSTRTQRSIDKLKK